MRYIFNINKLKYIKWHYMAVTVIMAIMVIMFVMVIMAIMVIMFVMVTNKNQLVIVIRF